MLSAELFRCPGCHAPLHAGGRQLSCESCGRSWNERSGYFDLIDSSAGEPTASSAEQRLMESELVARLYERIWRPTFVRLLAGGGADAFTGGFGGEFFIHKNALAIGERAGPWLDLSCGPGTFTRAMASAAPGDWVVGLDISRPMLDAAANRARGYSNVVLVRGDAHDLPLADESFAGINNSGALHVYDDPERVFTEVLRVLARGGVFVGSTFAPSRTLGRRLVSSLAGIRRFDPGELRAWLSRIGFADYEEVRLGGTFIFKVRKP